MSATVHVLRCTNTPQPVWNEIRGQQDTWLLYDGNDVCSWSGTLFAARSGCKAYKANTKVGGFSARLSDTLTVVGIYQTLTLKLAFFPRTNTAILDIKNVLLRDKLHVPRVILFPSSKRSNV